jgi:predicted extracellular nuclease
MGIMKSASCLLALLFLAFSPLSYATTDLYFSEYIEGSSYNKALEIYNNTGASVDLSAYQLHFYYNGNTVATRTIDLSGTLANGEVYVVADSQAGPEILAVTNQIDGTGWFNGDDAVELVHNGSPIDVIGQIGVDPGIAWGTAPTSTANSTLRRKISVTDGDANGFDAFDPAVEWDGFPQDSFDDLGHYTGGGGPISHCGEPTQPIHVIQGAGDTSPFVGQTVSVEAIVTADVQTGLRGFFIQQADNEVDTDPQTSEGLFVYSGGGATIAVGDRVRVTGLTELSNVSSVEVCASGLSITPAVVNLPFANSDAAEAYEGMAVVFPQSLSVTDNENLGRYDEVTLSKGRLYQPTQLATPGSAAQAIMAENALNQVTLDDASSQQNPDPIVFPAPALSADHTLRVGDTVTNLTGVMSYGFDVYRVYPTQTPNFVASNPRPVALELPAERSIRIASFNVLNYFTTLDNNGPVCGPAGDLDCRGANTTSEFERQQAKLVSALSGMQADVIGLMELENNGFGPDSAIANLVNALNLQAPPGVQYAYVDPGVPYIGIDAITVGLIYNINKVKIAGTPAILDSSIDSRFIDTRNRPTLAVSFQDRQTKQRFTVAVNHLKSKGSSCSDIGDPDTGDGQGNCNLTRKAAAEALVDWLAKSPIRIS